MQQEALRIQIGFASKYKLPIILHTRNAFNETCEVIEIMGLADVKGVFHCFSDQAKEAQRAIAMGYKLGIGGVVTFKNGGLDKVLEHVELKDLVLETDCPYLSPVPHRGKRNEPSYIAIVAHKIAELKKCSVEEVIQTTSINAKQLFHAIQ